MKLETIIPFLRCSISWRLCFVIIISSYIVLIQSCSKRLTKMGSVMMIIVLLKGWFRFWKENQNLLWIRRNKIWRFEALKTRGAQNSADENDLRKKSAQIGGSQGRLQVKAATNEVRGKRMSKPLVSDGTETCSYARNDTSNDFDMNRSSSLSNIVYACLIVLTRIKGAWESSFFACVLCPPVLK